MSNIYQIAEKTGLSPSTVARALSGNGYCSRKSREIVLAAAKELHYSPVAAAKTLKSKITNKIMICIPDICNPYYFKMIDGINQVLERYGYYTILSYTNRKPEKELQAIASLRERITDGMIIVSFDFNEKIMDAIRESEMPVILTNLYESYAYEENFDCVYVDHTKAIYIATTYCMRKGHRRIAFMVGNTQEQTGKERLLGYRKALEHAKIPFEAGMVIEADYTKDGGKQKMQEFLRKSEAPSAIVACNDLMGIGCMDALREHGLRVPEDVSIITLDNTDYCTCAYPKLTSVDMMQEQIGQNAATMIMERIKDGRNYKKITVLEPRIVERDSVISFKNTH